jgi:hypothetical protein
MLRDKIERKKNKEKDKKNNDRENVYYIWYKNKKKSNGNEWNWKTNLKKFQNKKYQ